MLSSLASTLKRVAEQFRIPVLVTNQITVRLPPQSSDDDVAAVIAPALGNTWAHAVNTRIMLTSLDAEATRRQFCVVKSPMLPPVPVSYTIASQGIVGLRQGPTHGSSSSSGGL
mmetsp:Transcript_24253/g.77873  ORF Transcript_24253/g.77873 Transcript_24253/m.77873 type:complete len:114 (-) Transcript_24253:2228-2569(-)